MQSRHDGSSHERAPLRRRCANGRWRRCGSHRRPGRARAGSLSARARSEISAHAQPTAVCPDGYTSRPSRGLVCSAGGTDRRVVVGWKRARPLIAILAAVRREARVRQRLTQQHVEARSARLGNRSIERARECARGIRKAQIGVQCRQRPPRSAPRRATLSRATSSSSANAAEPSAGGAGSSARLSGNASPLKSPSEAAPARAPGLFVERSLLDAARAPPDPQRP